MLFSAVILIVYIQKSSALWQVIQQNMQQTESICWISFEQSTQQRLCFGTEKLWHAKLRSVTNHTQTQKCQPWVLTFQNWITTLICAKPWFNEDTNCYSNQQQEAASQLPQNQSTVFIRWHQCVPYLIMVTSAHVSAAAFTQFMAAPKTCTCKYLMLYNGLEIPQKYQFTI